MVVDAAGTAITAREINRMLLITPELTETGLRVVAPFATGLEPLEVSTPDPGLRIPVTLWSSQLTAAVAGAEADEWFSRVLGVEARLVHLDDPTRRPTSPDFGDDGDVVSFADGYPLLLTSEDSLAALNESVLDAASEEREPLPMLRFRPNVVVAGAEAWAEEDWRRVRIGEATFRAVKGCARCVMTTIDPDTAAREKEPIATLARVRRFDRQTWFGTNLVPDTPGVTIRVGDDVEVLEAAEPGGGPIRTPTRNPVAGAH